MTEEIIKEKQIIIDNIDVSGCEYCTEPCEKYPHAVCNRIDARDCEGYIDLLLTDCEDNPNCTYKQLKRLEQENEELKETNKYQKKAIRMYDCIDKWDTKECHCACRCLGNEFCDDAAEKINTYRSALEEIKRYAEERCRQKVLDKINEVLNDK